MARNFLKRFTPDPETIRKHPSLRLFQRWLHDPNLWHMNRYSVSMAVFIGFLIAFIPLPIHIIAAAIVAIWWRANLTIAVSAIWISNPITIPAQFFMAYKIGARLLNTPARHFTFELSPQWVHSELNSLWQPLLLGCLVCGLVTAILGWGAVRIIWRMQVIARWRARQHRRTHPH